VKVNLDNLSKISTLNFVDDIKVVELRGREDFTRGGGQTVK